MAGISLRLAAVAAVCLVAFAMPASGRGGGGGGGFHGGGGGGFRGGGGGGFHGGGGFRGGGGMHFSAPAISRAAPSFSHGAMRSFARPSFRGGRVAHSFSRPSARTGMRSFSRSATRGHRSLGGTRLGARSAGNRLSATRLNGARSGLAAQSFHGTRGAGRTLGAAAVGGAAFAAGARLQHRADWRRHRGFFGWAGPVFWPFAYDDLYDDIYWSDGPYYDDPFWAYGYGDIYGGMFSPEGYDGIAGWASAPRSARAAAGGSTPATQQATPQATQWSSLCGDDASEINLPIDRMAAAITPTDEQRAALDALAKASAQAAQLIKAACPSDVAYTPTGRLQAMEQRVQSMVQSVALIRPPLDNFYNMLSDEQKARLNAIHREGAEPRTVGATAPAPACGPKSLIPAWPQAQIEKSVRPDEAQRVKLDALRDANTKAADMLKAACPAETPITPPARLAAIAERLDTLLSAVRLVRTALDDFYGSLRDEQKAQFNGIAPVVQNTRS
jgi:LTXXQ motif family protein